MIPDVLSVNLRITFLRIQGVEKYLLVLRPRIYRVVVRTLGQIYPGRVFKSHGRVLGRVTFTLIDKGSTYLLINGVISTSVYHQSELGISSTLPQPVGPQLVVRLILYTV